MSHFLRRAFQMATTRTPPRDPLIVILGATGTGKSKLAVDLALRFNGEIINGDAMQMYKGLPIITNKIPVAEREGMPHHLIDFIGLEEQPWTVKQFVRESQKVIEGIRQRGNLPILVGGTHYYTHALLYEDATLGGGQEEDSNEFTVENGGETHDEERGETWPILNAPTEEIYAKLQEVDPAMATRWHPKDRRKIQRSLEIWLKTGRTASEVYTEQQQSKMNGSTLTDLEITNGGLRYPSLLLWLEAEDAVLKDRLNKRVDQMVKDGLCEEAITMNRTKKDLTQAGIPVDEKKGIWVSIGYKELQPWLESGFDSPTKSSTSQKLLQECIESVKAGTRRYAKRQNRYIRIRLANDLKDVDALNKLFLLDSTNLDNWHSDITVKSQDLVQAFLAGEELRDPASVSQFASATFSEMLQKSSKSLDRVAKHCDICDKILMTEKEWQGHLVSRSHKKIMQSQRKQLNRLNPCQRNEAAIGKPP